MDEITKPKSWSNEDLDYLRNNYTTKEVDEIARILGRTHNAIKLKASRIGLKKPHHQQNDSYFDVIDSSEKAYWLGFIAADGYVIDNDKAGTWELGIELSTTDYLHLNQFKEAIGSDQDVRTRKKRSFLHRGIDKVYESCFVRLYSKQLVHSLKKYGIIQNKTNVLSFPNLPSEYIWDYIRGYFDGDGSIFQHTITSKYGKNTYVNVSFTCNCFEYLSSLKDFLNENDIASTIIKDKSTYVLKIIQKASVGRFFDCIYKDSECVKLKRKYERYCDFFNLDELPA